LCGFFRANALSLGILGNRNQQRKGAFELRASNSISDYVITVLIGTLLRVERSSRQTSKSSGVTRVPTFSKLGVIAFL
jgi:hypothetical protein